MTQAELNELKLWRQNPRCPCTRVALTPEHKMIFRTYAHGGDHTMIWKDPKAVFDEIMQCYRAVQRITVDLEFGVLVTKIVLWEDLFPGDPMLPKVENPAPPITKVLMGEWVGPNGASLQKTLDSITQMPGEPEFRMALGLDRV